MVFDELRKSGTDFDGQISIEELAAFWVERNPSQAKAFVAIHDAAAHDAATRPLPAGRSLMKTLSMSSSKKLKKPMAEASTSRPEKLKEPMTEASASGKPRLERSKSSVAEKQIVWDLTNDRRTSTSHPGRSTSSRRQSDEIGTPSTSTAEADLTA